MTKRKAPEERVYRAVRRLMVPRQIWPDPKPDILAAIRRALLPKESSK